ncbi:rna-directed dna polymerase from mobile element jockey-like [Willisornis vidua]|uniref:Rna-directed dna polymerase from mobile element jockey-like n=1 Tax=Willisornis vidua TaxID=1566151 RepID=A0ABQ9CQ25_9PASS|nr:rna-directed dna polymerase from mobile element jockey-like [Willisornis vidua]
MEKIHLEDMLRHMEDREVIQDSQHGFNKGKSGQPSEFLCRSDYSSEQGKTTDDFCLDSCEAFDMIPHDILSGLFGGQGTHWTVTSRK